MTYRSTKTYGHERGLSCAFRQWRAESHCRLIHGYSLAFKFTFEAERLDQNNWVVDFGSLKPLLRGLENTFDHKLIVAIDDPQRRELRDLMVTDMADVIELPATGCEAFAAHAWGMADGFLKEVSLAPRVRCIEVECMEHGANSGIYRP